MVTYIENPADKYVVVIVRMHERGWLIGVDRDGNEYDISTKSSIMYLPKSGKIEPKLKQGMFYKCRVMHGSLVDAFCEIETDCGHTIRIPRYADHEFQFRPRLLEKVEELVMKIETEFKAPKEKSKLEQWYEDHDIKMIGVIGVRNCLDDYTFSRDITQEEIMEWAKLMELTPAIAPVGGIRYAPGRHDTVRVDSSTD